MRILNEDDLRLIRLLEKQTRAEIKDCIQQEEWLTIIVHNGIEQAIGAKGENAKRIERIMKKRIKIVQWNADIKQFIKNVFAPYPISEISEENGKVILKAPDYKTRGMLIGKSASTLRHNEAVIKRFFNVNEIKVAE
ncbi:NusA-like transcription termination signal-binding factor [Candidatus Woesearchaeota archaeon]|nr:NusA-like transcription termination signal-binding factor [Candidatus Woesearchaeota archaeon]